MIERYATGPPVKNGGRAKPMGAAAQDRAFRTRERIVGVAAAVTAIIDDEGFVHELQHE